MTKSERFTLSKGSARLVSEGLKQQLQIDVYVTRGLPKYEAFIQDLTDLMGEYERAAGGKVKYTLIEAKTEEQRTAAKDAGLQEAAFGDVSETGQDQATITRGFMGIAFKYGSEKDAIPILSPDRARASSSGSPTRSARSAIAPTTSRRSSASHRQGRAQARRVEPRRRAGRPPRAQHPRDHRAGAALLQVRGRRPEGRRGGDQQGAARPHRHAARQGLHREGAAADRQVPDAREIGRLLLGRREHEGLRPSMRAELSTRGLEKLLDGYGIEMKKEAILDWARSVQIPVQTNSGQVLWFRAPGVVQSQNDGSLDEGEQLLDSSFAGFFRLEELAFPFPSTLIPHPEKQPQAKLSVVARSTPRTTVDASDSIEMKISSDWKPKGEYGQRAFAIAVEGTLKSAFGAETSKAPSRLLVISASQFLANPFARAGNPPPMPPQMAMMGGMGGDEDLQMLSQPYAQKYLTGTILAFKNILDWMGGDSDLIAASAKLLGETNLTYLDITKPKQDETDDEESVTRKMEDYKKERLRVQSSVQWTLTFLPAALFAAFGILRWRMREGARGRISLD
jgi:hypothetical protein